MRISVKNNVDTLIFHTAICVAGTTNSIYRRDKSEIWLAIPPARCACGMEGSMKVILYLSDMMIPFVVFYIVGIGIIQKNKVYDDFIEGAKDGLKTVVGVMPTMVGLMIGVGVLSSSGFLDFFTKQIAKMTLKIGLPPAVVPAMIVRMFSSSAATGLVLDVFKQFGTDSYEGLLSSIMMSSTETIFYTMSVYFMTAKVTKTRWTLAGALISTLAGIIASVIMTKMMI